MLSPSRYLSWDQCGCWDEVMNRARVRAEIRVRARAGVGIRLRARGRVGHWAMNRSEPDLFIANTIVCA